MPRDAIAELLVEQPRAVVPGTQLEVHREDTRGPCRSLEPIDELTAQPQPLIAWLHGEQIQVRMDAIELHDRKAREPPPIARREHDAIAVAQAPLDALFVPRPREALLDELARHRGDRRHLVVAGQAYPDLGHRLSIVEAWWRRHP
jgi:hypothetical protein